MRFQVPIPIRRFLLTLGVLCASAWSPTHSIADDKPLKVYVLIGQSNMQGHAEIRTLEHLKMNPATAEMLSEIQTADGTPRVFEDVRIAYLSSNGEKHGPLTTGFGAKENKIGPELTFGIRMHRRLGEPILIIKAAWGGKSLHTDFRPPSAGPYQFNATQLSTYAKQGKNIDALRRERVMATGHYYRLTVEHVKTVLSKIDEFHPDYDPAAGYELSGLVWFQGWNDMVDRGVYPNRDQPDGYRQYSKVLEHFIRDLRKDLSSPELPFVIGVMGVGGPVDRYPPEKKGIGVVHQNFRDAMAAPASKSEFANSVVAVLTERHWDLQLSDLRSREAQVSNTIKRLAKAESITRAEAAALKEESLAKEFKPEELKTLRMGVSNAEYHYLGSANIMTQIGQAFANALIDMKER